MITMRTQPVAKKQQTQYQTKEDRSFYLDLLESDWYENTTNLYHIGYDSTPSPRKPVQPNDVRPFLDYMEYIRCH